MVERASIMIMMMALVGPDASRVDMNAVCMVRLILENRQSRNLRFACRMGFVIGTARSSVADATARILRERNFVALAKV
jgi:hypothetical protein